MTTSFKFHTYGDAVSPFDFLDFDNLTADAQEAKAIINIYAEKEKEVFNKFDKIYDTGFDFFSDEMLDAYEKASAATKSAMTEMGYEKGQNFIQTPAARLEWEYLGCKMSADPNDSNSDVSTFEIRIVK